VVVGWGRIAALAGRIITQFRRDRRTLALIFFIPIIVLSLVGYLIELEPSGVTVGVVNEDEPVASISMAGQIVAAIEESTDFTLVESSRDEVMAQIKDGEFQAALVFPFDLTRSAVTGDSPSFSLVLEGSDPQVAGYIREGVAQAIPEALAAVPGAGSRMIDVKPVFIYGGPRFRTLDYLAPAFLVLIPFLFVFLLTSVSFLRERAQGTMERLLASPLSRAESVLGYMLGFGLFALAESMVILLFTVYVLNINYAGSLGVVVLAVIVMAMTAVNLGIFLSTFARNEFQAVQFMPLVIFPQALLGGLFWAVESLPWSLRWISYLMPMTYANRAVREVMIKGASVLDWPVGSNLLILLGFAGVFIVLSSLTLRREVA